MFTRDTPVCRQSGKLSIYEFVTEINRRGIFLCISIIDSLHACPIQCAQTHGAWFAGTIDNASFELKRSKLTACRTYSVDLRMRRRIIGFSDSINPSRHNPTVASNYNSAKRTSTVTHTVLSKARCHVYIFFIAIFKYFFCHKHILLNKNKSRRHEVEPPSNLKSD